MRPVRVAHIVVVAESDHALVLAACLRRMGLSEITTVDRLDAARRLCRAGGVDACIVAIDDTIADARPTLQADAPGSGCDVPTLMIAAAVNPGLRMYARRAGYAALLPAAIPPRMLYRRICAVLQSRRRADRRRRRPPSGMVMTRLSRATGAMSGKPTLH